MMSSDIFQYNFKMRGDKLIMSSNFVLMDRLTKKMSNDFCCFKYSIGTSPSIVNLKILSFTTDSYTRYNLVSVSCFFLIEKSPSFLQAKSHLIQQPNLKVVTNI